jgi:transposase InsO family protein
MARSIESLLDTKNMSIEELTGRLKVCEEDNSDDDAAGEAGGGKLLLTEEQWRARMKGDGSSGSSGGSGSGKNGRNKGRGKDSRDKGKTSGGASRDDECRYCGKLGHWARDCHKKKREEAHLVKEGEDGDEKPALHMAQICTADDEPEHVGGSVFLNEERAHVRLGEEAEPAEEAWYLDTGASNHMTGDRAVFAKLDTSVTGSVRFGDNSIVQIKGRGVVLMLVRGGEHRELTEVYFIPKLKTSIVSMGQLDENGCPSAIRGGFMSVWDRDERLLVKVPRTRNRLYKVVLKIAQPICLAACRTDTAWTWHERMGHQNFSALQKMARTGMVHGLPTIGHVEQLCEACLAGKQRRSAFPQAAKHRAPEVLDLVHADLCGPISPPTPGGKRHFLLLVDDASRFMWAVLLLSKDAAADAIKRFKAMAELESKRSLRTFRTDRGGEFTSTALGKFFQDHGVQRHLTAPYSPQQNGVVERRNQTVVGMARSMLKAKGMPNRFWGEAVLTAVYILNRSLTRALEGRTPFEAWYGRKPSNTSGPSAASRTPRSPSQG